MNKNSNKVESIKKESIKVADFDFTFMRKDPPVDKDYINSLHLLGLAETHGATVFNKQNSIKEFNEKIFAIHFKEFIPQTLVTSNIKKVIEFQLKHVQEFKPKKPDQEEATSKCC